MTPEAKEALLRRLDEAAAPGLDLSPGDPLAKEAAVEIRRLQQEVEIYVNAHNICQRDLLASDVAAIATAKELTALRAPAPAAGPTDEPSEAELTLAGALMILAWEAGELSEGQVAAALRTDRLTCRIQRDDLIARGVVVAETLRPARPTEAKETTPPAAASAATTTTERKR